MVGVVAELWAAAYDRVAAREERAGADAYRRRLCAEARGQVVEIGVGTGRNLRYYERAEHVLAVEPDPAMRRRAERVAARAPVPVTVVAGDAADLPVADASVDTVVSGLVLCTVGDLDRVLGEIRRVLRPGGELRFWEHVRAADHRLARWQDRLEVPWRWVGRGCHPNRATVDAIRRAGFELVWVEGYDQPGVPPIVRPHVIGVARRGG